MQKRKRHSVEAPSTLVAQLKKVVAVVQIFLKRTTKTKMAGNAGNNQRIIPLDEGWDDEIKAKVREKKK